MNGQSVISEVQEALELYLHGIHFGDITSLRRAMHPDCRMVCTGEQGYTNIGMDQYFELVARRQSPRDTGEQRADEIHSIHQVSAEMAVARLLCLVLGKLCDDALTLIRHESAFKVISKVFVYNALEPVKEQSAKPEA